MSYAIVCLLFVKKLYDYAYKISPLLIRDVTLANVLQLSKINKYYPPFLYITDYQYLILPITHLYFS